MGWSHSTTSSGGHRESVLGGTFIEGDLGNTALLDNIFSRHSVTAVMHFAAYSIVGESVENPLVYYRNNCTQTIDLLDAMIRYRVKHFIFSSTAAVYGEPIKVPVTEDDPCNPTNPYGATKIAVERLLADCEQSYGLKYISLRYFNAAGADISGKLGERHEPETHLIPPMSQGKRSAGEEPAIAGVGDPGVESLWRFSAAGRSRQNYTPRVPRAFGTRDVPNVY